MQGLIPDVSTPPSSMGKSNSMYIVGRKVLPPHYHIYCHSKPTNLLRSTVLSKPLLHQFRIRSTEINVNKTEKAFSPLGLINFPFEHV